jgi:hypothetical protein
MGVMKTIAISVKKERKKRAILDAIDRAFPRRGFGSSVKAIPFSQLQDQDRENARKLGLI